MLTSADILLIIRQRFLDGRVNLANFNTYRNWSFIRSPNVLTPDTYVEPILLSEIRDVVFGSTLGVLADNQFLGLYFG